jgi:hypothetical protein
MINTKTFPNFKQTLLAIVSAFLLAFAFPAFAGTVSFSPDSCFITEIGSATITASGFLDTDQQLYVFNSAGDMQVSSLGPNDLDVEMTPFDVGLELPDNYLGVISIATESCDTYVNCLGNPDFVEDLGVIFIINEIRPSLFGEIGPANISEISGITSALFADFWPFIGLAIGIPLGFWLVKSAIKIRPKEPKDSTNYYNSDVDVAILKLARLKYEAGQLDQDAYEKILKKYS